MLQKAVEDNPGCDGIILGGHGLFTWGMTQHECYLSSIRTIDQMGEFIRGARAARQPPALRRRRRSRPRSPDRESPIAEIFPAPARRGVVEPPRHRPLRRVGRGARLRQLDVGRRSCAASARAVRITSCARASRRCSSPGIRRRRRRRRCATRIDERIVDVPRGLREVLQGLRRHGVAGAARQQSFRRRDPGPRPVRVRQGQARSAHHDRVLRQRDPRHAGGERARRRTTAAGEECVPQVRRPEQAKEFKTFHNYVALPRLEAFRIEYWALEEAKLQRMPPEKEFSRKVVVVVGGGSGIGREVALQIARRGGHVVVADANAAGAADAAREAAALSSKEMVQSAALDLTSRDTIAAAVARGRAAVRRLRLGDQHRGDLSDARARHPAGGGLGQDAGDQRDVELRAGAGGREDPAGAEAARVDRAHRVRPTPSCRRRGARPTTSARRRSTT